MPTSLFAALTVAGLMLAGCSVEPPAPAPIAAPAPSLATTPLVASPSTAVTPSPSPALTTTTTTASPPAHRAPAASGPVGTSAHIGASQDVTAQQFGVKWPLTVDRAIIGCRPLYPPDVQIVALFLNDGGTLYGLNGTALGLASREFQDPHPIWKPGFDLSPLQDAARQLC